DEKARAVDRRRSHLEVRVTRAGQRPGAKQCATQVRGAAAGPTDDAARWNVERRPRGGEDACLTQHVEPFAVHLRVQLVARRPIERAPAVGADLGAHTEVAQQRERAARGRGGREIQVNGDHATLEMPGTADVEERRYLGVPAARAVGRYPRELGTELLGQRHYRLNPSRASRRRL